MRMTFKTNASGRGDDSPGFGFSGFGQQGYREAPRVSIGRPDLLCEPSATNEVPGGRTSPSS